MPVEPNGRTLLPAAHWEAALEAAGIEFIRENGGGPGARLRNRPSVTLFRCDNGPQPMTDLKWFPHGTVFSSVRITDAGRVALERWLCRV
jgi:hypothetical protein